MTEPQLVDGVCDVCYREGKVVKIELNGEARVLCPLDLRRAKAEPKIYVVEVSIHHEDEYRTRARDREEAEALAAEQFKKENELDRYTEVVVRVTKVWDDDQGVVDLDYDDRKIQCWRCRRWFFSSDMPFSKTCGTCELEIKHDIRRVGE